MAAILQDVPGRRLTAPYSKDNQLNGIIAGLTDLAGGQNLHASGHVKVILSTSLDTPGHAREHLIKVDNSTIAATKDLANSWIGYDFGPSVRIVPISYTLKARPDYDPGHKSAPHSYIIETSEDGVTWMAIDWQTDVTDIKNNSAVVHFEVKRVPSPSRYIRICQTQKNGHGTNHLVLAAFEIFGACYSIE